MRKWRVGTISMGLLLIATGLILVISEFQGFNGAGLILRWWPVILIVLGLEILVYILFSKEEQPKIKYDGLSIFLVILVILVSSAVYGVNLFLKGDFSQGILGEMGYFKNESILNQNYDIDAAKVRKIQINNNKGQIQVERYEGDKIKVDASIIIKNNNEEKAVNIAQNLVEVTEGETLTFQTRSAGILEDNRNYQVTVNYAVKVPKELEFDIDNEFGEITLEDLTGNIKIDGKFNDIEVDHVTGDVQIESFSGRTSVKDISGKVTVDNEQGEILYSTKEITNSDVTLNCKMGGITVELPRTQQGTFDVSARFGDINVEEFESQLSVNREDTKQDLKGTIGKSSPAIFLYTENGSIDLRGK